MFFAFYKNGPNDIRLTHNNTHFICQQGYVADFKLKPSYRKRQEIHQI